MGMAKSKAGTMTTHTSYNNNQQDQSPVEQPQTTPITDIGRGHPEYHFVVAIMEMQKSLGEISGSIHALTRTVENNQVKVDNLTELKPAINTVIKSIDSLESKVNDLAELKPAVNATVKSVDSLKSKVHDLHSWRNMILGAH